MKKTFILNYDQKENGKRIGTNDICKKCNSDMNTVFEKLNIEKPESFDYDLDLNSIGRHTLSFSLKMNTVESDNLIQLFLNSLNCQTFFIF